MTYSFTEKKRIRKSFAKRAAVLDVPFLLATQINSYAEFLQAEVAADKRRETGLQSAFTSVFPISSHSGNARLEFVSYGSTWSSASNAALLSRARCAPRCASPSWTARRASRR